ncbi:MAG: hypothetical protein KA174_00570 [Chitinophagales bacterium]|nr:hypothetical protein [Saprospirales bacterium]MBK8351840.1 hypothetical protein [Saprospirales bacterium]MBP6659136.1 hypothetical protein [Chitinophagales bacterium]
MKKLFLFLFLFGTFSSFSQDIEGKWFGTFIQYIHNSYDVEMELQKMPGDIFSAQLKITDGEYYGQYQISGNICKKRYLEITAIFLMKENGGNNWIDCLNGVWDLNEDENELTFTDTWLQTEVKKNDCKVRFIQKDMFTCLRSSYLRKVMYSDMTAEFDENWKNYEEKLKRPIYVASTKNDTTIKPKLIEQKTETQITAKNEDRAPIVDTFEEVKMRPVYVKDEIEVSSPDIVIEYWDRYTEDGDSINLYINKKPILQNQLLTKVKKSISIHLEKEKNYLVLDAINLGKEPPNTASITIKDGKKIQNVSLTSTMKTSGALKITVK